MKTVICIGGLCCAGKSRYIATVYPKGKIVDIYELHRDYLDHTNGWYWARFLERIDKALVWHKQVIAEAIWTDKQVSSFITYSGLKHWRCEFYWLPVSRVLARTRAETDFAKHINDPEHKMYHEARLRIIDQCPASTHPLIRYLWDWNKSNKE